MRSSGSSRLDGGRPPQRCAPAPRGWEARGPLPRGVRSRPPTPVGCSRGLPEGGRVGAEGRGLDVGQLDLAAGHSSSSPGARERAREGARVRPRACGSRIACPDHLPGSWLVPLGRGRPRLGGDRSPPCRQRPGGRPSRSTHAHTHTRARTAHGDMGTCTLTDAHRCTHMNADMQGHGYVHTHRCTQMHTHASTHGHAQHVGTWVSAHPQYTHRCTHTDTCTHGHTQTRRDMGMCSTPTVHTQMHTHACTDRQGHGYVHTHSTHTDIHTDMCTRGHAQRRRDMGTCMPTGPTQTHAHTQVRRSTHTHLPVARHVTRHSRMNKKAQRLQAPGYL